MRFTRKLSLAVSSALLLVACGDDQSSTTDAKASTLTLLAYESFTPPSGAFDAFTAETGIKVEIVAAGDTGEMVAKAVLTSGNPEGDVMWGVDNTLLSRAVDAEIFDPYVSNVEGLDSDLIASGLDTVTPVDYGDVCLNYDIPALEKLGLRTPASFADLAATRVSRSSRDAECHQFVDRSRFSPRVDRPRP
ncbi:MAG: extracellular solute-binding protein [Ilumatobacteraceae bacterium]